MDASAPAFFPKDEPGEAKEGDTTSKAADTAASAEGGGDAASAAARGTKKKDEDDDTAAAPPSATPEDISPTIASMTQLGQSELWRPTYAGRIKTYNEQKGFGFIECPDTERSFGRDVFVHRLQMMEGSLSIGQQVSFELDTNKNGFPQARNIIPTTPTASNEHANWSGYGGGTAHDPHGQYHYGATGGMDWAGDMAASEHVEDLLRACTGSQDMWEIIEQYGHSFGKRHVVTALNQLGLCRQCEGRSTNAHLTCALVDRLVLFRASDFTPDESSRTLWAITMLDEVQDHVEAHRFCMELGAEAAKRCSEYSPSQMSILVRALAKLVRTTEEDEIVGKVTSSFSDYALGGGFPRFPPEELRHWYTFLQEAASPPPQQPAYPTPFGGPMGGKGIGMGFGGKGYGMAPAGMGPGSIGPSGMALGGKGWGGPSAGPGYPFPNPNGGSPYPSMPSWGAQPGSGGTMGPGGMPPSKGYPAMGQNGGLAWASRGSSTGGKGGREDGAPSQMSLQGAPRPGQHIQGSPAPHPQQMRGGMPGQPGPGQRHMMEGKGAHMASGAVRPNLPTPS